MKKRLCSALLALALIVSLSVPAFAANRDWESAYASIIKSAGSMREYDLVDLDLNGVPELLIGYIGGTMLTTTIDKAYTFRDGKAQELTIPSISYIYCMPFSSNDVAYRFYRNNSTGALKVEGSTPYRSGWAYNNTTWIEFGLSWNTLNAEATYISANLTNETNYKESKEYYIGQNKVSESAWNSSFNSRNDGWTEIANVGFARVDSQKKMTNSAITAFFAEYKDGNMMVASSTNTIQVNGQKVDMGAYLINENNYFKLRDIAKVLNNTGSQFEVGWDGVRNMISLTTGKSYTAVGGELSAIATGNQIGSPNASSIYIDGSPADLTAYTINENNYFKLRDLGEVLNFDVDWDGATETVIINSR